MFGFMFTLYFVTVFMLINNSNFKINLFYFKFLYYVAYLFKTNLTDILEYLTLILPQKTDISIRKVTVKFIVYYNFSQDKKIL